MTTARIPFSASDEGAITGLTQWMLVVSIIHFVIGAIALIFSCLACVGVASLLSGGLQGILAVFRAGVFLLSGPVLIGQGVLLMQARTAFDAVVATDTNDQALLGHAFGRLRLFFMIEVGYGLIGLLTGCIDIVTPVAGRFL